MAFRRCRMNPPKVRITHHLRTLTGIPVFHNSSHEGLSSPVFRGSFQLANQERMGGAMTTVAPKDKRRNYQQLWKGKRLESGLTSSLRTLRVGGVGLLQNFPESAIRLFHLAVISVELDILRQALGVEIKNIG